MPFTYLITPPYAHQKGVIAFTVHNKIITGYMGESNGRRVNFDYCVDDYIKNSNKTVSSVRQHAVDHKLMHNEEADYKITHCHLRHNQKITPELLMDFLNQMRLCNEVPEYTGLQTYLTDDLIKDIVNKYTMSLKNNSINHFYSNNPYYQQLPQSITPPSIAEHAKCTQIMIDGCAPGNPYNPPRIAGTYSIFNRHNAVNSAALLTSAIFSIYSLFLLCKTLKKPESKSTREIKHKHSQI